jgi:hypothetical protein
MAAVLHDPAKNPERTSGSAATEPPLLESSER